MDGNIITFSEYNSASPADKPSEKQGEKKRQKTAEIIQFRPRLQLSADGHTIILNF